MDRKGFLKLAGLTAIAGAAGKWGAVADAAGKTSEASSGRHAGEGSSKAVHRWAMAVDVKKCVKEKGCELCTEACHAEHNVPDFGNPKDEVKWIWKEPFERVFHEHEHEFVPENPKHGPTPVLCNHCDNPACVKVCPTKATWKRESDGIVMMDWHRCIGCRYCVAACPYGSRSFNWRDPRPFIKDIRKEFPTRAIGVVEKCNFCEERLAKGKPPACVEACPAGALVFGDLKDPRAEIRRLLGSKFSLRRKPGLGTRPQVYYIVT
ncbi:MAG: sulfate reduction electron transfer complex DsrMKJOP subunit DsrO [Elusimicrobiota bacterium]